MNFLAQPARAAAVVAAALLSSVSAEANTLVLRHATAFVGENLERRADCTIEIRDGQITEVLSGKSAPIAGDATEIDATGKFLVPGFIEMHAHLLLHPWDKEGRISPQFDRASTERFLRLLLAYGITTVRDPGAPTEAAVILRQRVAEESDWPAHFHGRPHDQRVPF